MDEEDFKDFQDQDYIAEKMGGSIYELQIEDPSTTNGANKGPYSHYDNRGDKEKDSVKERIRKLAKDLSEKKKSKRKCEKR